MSLEFFLDIVSLVLMSAGGAFVFIGGLGALRMPDLFTRMHAASVTDSMGPILIIGGIILQAGLTLASVKLMAILLFLLLTGLVTGWPGSAAERIESASGIVTVRPGSRKSNGSRG